VVFFVFMANSEILPSTFQPTSFREWVGTPYADIPCIPGLDIDSAHYRYVSQGLEREVLADETVNSLGSDGFTRCSGLVLTDPKEKTITMAHLEPHSDAVLSYLEQKSKDRVARIALFYGSLSVRHSELEDLILTNYFGPMQHTSTHFESGNSAWGMVFNRVTNQVKIFTRQPSQTITTFEL
jgi:hypothetical protein